MKRVLFLLLLFLVGCSKGEEGVNNDNSILNQPEPKLNVTFEHLWWPSQTYDWNTGHECSNCYDLDNNYAYIQHYDYGGDTPSNDIRFPVFEGYHYAIDTLIVDVRDVNPSTLGNWKPETNSYFWCFGECGGSSYTVAGQYDYPRFIGHIEFIGFNEFSQLGWKANNNFALNPSWDYIRYFSSNLEDDFIYSMGTKGLNKEYGASDKVPIFQKAEFTLEDVKKTFTYSYFNNSENRLKYAVGTEHKFDNRLSVVKSITIE